MNRKREIASDIWDIMRQVYKINAASDQSDKQEELITKIVEYIDANLSTRRKKQVKEKECLKE